MNDNDVTLKAYEAHAQLYLDAMNPSVDGPVKEWLDAITKELPKDADIIEFGSGTGRDARYLTDLGLHVQCTDASDSFRELLKKEGFDALKLNLLEDPIEGSYDVALANAVLLHFAPDETDKVLRKVHGALKDDGVFGFSVKEGEGEVWSEAKLGMPRYFHYWKEDGLREALQKAGYSSVTVLPGGLHKGSTWLFVIAKK